MSGSAPRAAADVGQRFRPRVVTAWVVAAVISLGVPAGLVAWRWLAVAPAATGTAVTATIAATSPGGSQCFPGAVVGEACDFHSAEVLVSYHVGETTVWATVPVYDENRYRDGEPVGVRYDPAHPAFAVIPSDAGTLIDYSDPRIVISLIWLGTLGFGTLIAACAGVRRLWIRLAARPAA